MTKSETILKIENLNFSYRHSPILQKVNLELKKGEFLAIIGPNGGGKSTLLKLILGILPIQEGKIEIFGKPPLTFPEKIGYVPQYIEATTLFPIKVTDFILTGLIGLKKFVDEKKALEKVLSQLEIENLKNELVENLSGGQRQKVYVARALISDPELLILDEPTANIDFEGQKFLYEFFHSLIPQKTIIIVSHQFQFTLCYASKIAFLDKTICLHDKFKTNLEDKDFKKEKFHCHLDMLEYLRKLK